MRYKKISWIVLLFILSNTNSVFALKNHYDAQFVVDDKLILTNLVYKLQTDTKVHEEHIHIKVKNGVVILMGWVPELKQINRTIEIAEQLLGVREVKNYLYVKLPKT